MAELADAPDLGSGGTPRAGSSPVTRILKTPIFQCFFTFVLHVVLHSLLKCLFALVFITFDDCSIACLYTFFKTSSLPHPPLCMI